MKIVTVVGARPQFIKAAAVSRIIRRDFDEVLLHTGQHYDKNMSDIFFDELDIPRPNINLAVGSASHAKQTADMMVGIEEVLIKEKPNYLMVYGDTNSTLAGGLAAIKLHIPIIHVEAGLRSYNMSMPEEINRVLTDRISNVLFCPTESSVRNLEKENILNNVFNVGDVMCDAVLYYSKNNNIKKETFFSQKINGLFNKINEIEKWYLATIHRAENTDNKEKLSNIIEGLEKLDYPVIFPVHPRITAMIEELYIKNKYSNVLFIDPIGYLEMLYFTKNAIKVITDSGGLQKEAYMLGTPCITIRNETEWVETLTGNHNILANPLPEEIVYKVNNTEIDDNKREDYYGSGNAAEKICTILKEISK